MPECQRVSLPAWRLASWSVVHWDVWPHACSLGIAAAVPDSCLTDRCPSCLLSTNLSCPGEWLKPDHFKTHSADGLPTCLLKHGRSFTLSQSSPMHLQIKFGAMLL